MDEEEQERKRKLEAGKAKLAQFRQRKGQSDGQASIKKTKKKKKTSSDSKHQEQSEEAPEASLSQSDEAASQTGPSGAGATAEFTIMRTLPHGETIKHDKTYTIEPESEVSTTAEDYSSEVVGDNVQVTANSTGGIAWEEEFKVRETFSERDPQSALSRLEVMEDELVGKQQEIEELNRELEEMRAAYGTEGLQQLQEFETAIKQRDGIITQLTSNLQQARKEKDDIMREFLELTEQSQKLKIQFQHLQASETLRNTSHSSTAADLLHSRQQILTYQQQLEERDHQMKLHQKEIEDFKAQVTALQKQIHTAQQQKELELSYEQKLSEKDLLLESLKSALHHEGIKSLGLNERISAAEKSADELREQLTQKSQEIGSLSEELSSSRQKERRSSDEIKQLMGAVENLQKKHHRDSQSEAELAQRMELETQRKLEQLQAELDEMHGQQIVHMKQELARQHRLEIDRLLAEHKQEVDRIAGQTTISTTNQRVNELNAAVNELNARLQQSDDRRNKMKEDFSQRLQAVSAEKSQLQKQIEDLLQDLRIAREQVHKARQSLTEKENKLNEASSLFVTIDGLKAELAAAHEFTKELESKHEAEVTNYKIKLEMLEREKDAVLDRMAESQEAELEKLRTSFLFSQEEELTKLREDLTREHRTNIENLKGNLEVQFKQQVDQVKHDAAQSIAAMQNEKDGLITKRNNLMLENSKLKDLLQSASDPKSERMMIQINELQKELECLRREEKEKGTIEQEVQVLQLQVETLEKEVKEKDALCERVASLERDNKLLKDQNDALQRIQKERELEHCDNVEQSNHSLKNEVERLESENKLLRDLEHQLKEEIERQKNTFSFAEKNFEVNYQELKEEYSCLVKLKEQLEEGKSRLEEEYKAKLDTLHDELVKLKQGDSEVSDKSDVSGAFNLDKADEVVEKDTTELMEKLEIAQRDKRELSLKLSSISEELQLKQNEINRLKEQVKSLCSERGFVTAFDNVNVHLERKVVSSDLSQSSVKEAVHPTATPLAHLPPQIPSSQQGSKDASAERESLLQRLDDLTRELEKESSVLGSARSENEQLQQKLDAVLQEQAETMLQLEAQRISLTQIHKAELELMEERFQSEKTSELRILRESLLRDQEEKMLELQSQHQGALERLPQQHTADGGESCQDLTQLLLKRIHAECADINQVLFGKETEEEDQAEQERNVSLNEITFLMQERAALQTLQGNLTTLLERFAKEYKQMGDLSCYMGQTADLTEKRLQPDIAQLQQLVIHSQGSASDVCEGLTPPPSEEAERLKVEFSQQRAQLEEKQAQEIEHLRSYFQQQLKENEERFSKEIIHLQQRLQDVTAVSLQLGELCGPESDAELRAQEAAMFQSAYAPLADTLKQVDEAAGMGDPSSRKPVGPIYHQLQSLRQALFSKYVDEVNALKKQHETELDQLRADLTEKFTAENAALRQEVIQLTSPNQEALNGSFQPTLCPIPEEKSDTDLNQLLEERYQEKMEHEIARVIVEMSIAFAQQTELARLASLEKTEPQEHPQDQSAAPHVDTTELDRETPDLQASELDQQEDLDLKEPLVTDVTDVDLILGQGDTILEKEPPAKEEEVLKEEDCNPMVTMGAESAKYQQMYEERVEEMRQELVRQEQEYQQATEALRLTHAAQLESQMYDQEQMLAELHRLRAQLAENASATGENQASEREKILLEELEALKQTCDEVAGKRPPRFLQDSGSQTQDEPVTQPESREQAGRCGRDEEETRGEESEGSADPKTERKNLKRVNKRLLKILLEVVKTTGAAEETIGRHVVGLLDKSGRRPSASKVTVWEAEQEDSQVGSAAGVTVTAGGDAGSWVKQEGVWTEAAAEEDLDVPLTEADFPGTGISPEEEAQLLSISTRLQATVEKLLEAINETSNQLEHARAAQTELVRESVKRKQETTDLLRCQEELQERLNEEAKAREHLALELSRAEGLLDGYTDERVFLEKQMQEKNDLIRHLEQELQNTGNRLQELEQERQQIQEEKELLSRQKLALKAGAAPAEQQLLEETEKLLKEKIEVQRQAEKDSGDLNKHVKVLEVELEEQVSRFVELEQEKNSVLEDLRQKNLSLEKQLEKTRRFLDEQAVDREHERDVFQQEIQKLEQQLKLPQRHQPVNDEQNNEVEKLESHLKEKTDKCSELLLCKEQLQRDVQERNEEIEKLESRIREVEQALLVSADTMQKAEDRRLSFAGVKGEMPLEAQLQVEREATDRKEKEITNLVEQLEQFREELENKNEEVQQLHMQLEIQRKESATRLQELEQENKILKDDLELSQHGENSSPRHTHYRQGKMEEDLLSKEQEIELLNEQIAKLQVQLDAAADNKVIEEKNEQIKEYKSQIKCLKSEQEQLKKNSEEEIEKLNEVIEKLQEELSNIEQIDTVGFTSMAEVVGLGQSSEMTERNDFLPSWSGHGDGDLGNTEDAVMEIKKRDNKEELSETSSNVAQGSVQDMESQLKQLLESVKEKDLNLKQYFDQVITLKEESQALNKTMERLKLELAEKDQRLRDMEGSKTELHASSAVTWAPGTDEALLNSKLQATKTELKCVKEELETFKRSSQNNIKEESAASVLSQEEVDTKYKASIESLTESLREKTAQHLAVEALLLSVQETSHSTICELQSQLHDLQKSVLQKESQLQELANKQKISVDANGIPNDGESQTSHKETYLVQAKVFEESKEDPKLLKGALNQLHEFHKKIDIVKENISSAREPGLEVAITEKTEETINHSLYDNTTPNMVQNFESQLQELQRVIQIKDSELLQFINQKDLVDQQVQEIDRLNEEIGNLKQALAQAGSGDTLSSKESLEKQSPPQKDEFDELVQTKAQLEKAKLELALLTEELTKVKLTQNHDVRVENASTKGDIAKSEPTVASQEQALREKAAERLVSQTMCISLEETTQEAIYKMELQLQELQRVIELKDSELLQYAQQKDLLDHQTREVERLNGLVKTLKQGLTDMSSQAWESPRVDKGSSRQADLEDGRFLTHKTDLASEELISAKAELGKAKIELALLKGELSEASLPQKLGDIGHGEAELKVPQLEQALREKTAETTIHNMEPQLQELQKIIQVKDSELLQYVQQKELLDQQTREVKRLNDVVKSLQQELSDVSSDAKLSHEESKGSSRAEVLLQNAELENKELVQAKAELDKAKMELAALKEELLKLSLAQEHDVQGLSPPREGEAALEVSPLEQTLREKTAELLASQTLVASLEKTTQASIKNMESQLQELQKIIQLKDSELLQYIQQKELLDQQTREVERLNEVVKSLQQELSDVSSDAKLSHEESKGSSREKVLLQNAELENKELIQSKDELDKAKMELAALKEERSKASLSQENHDIQVLSPPREGEAALEVSQLEQALREKTAELLASQTLVVSLEKSTQATIKNMESQLQDLQKIIQLKDSELLQYVQQKELLDQQTREVERLNEVVKSLQQELSDMGSDAKLSHEESKGSSREELLLQNAELEKKELIQAKAELDKAKMELAALKEELSKPSLAQEHNIHVLSPPKEGEAACEVSQLEHALKEKTAELLASQTLVASLEKTTQATIKNLESQLQELQTVIDLKDSELLQYISLKDLIDPLKEGVHFSELIQIYKQQSEDDLSGDTQDGVGKSRVGKSREVLLLQNAILDKQEPITVEPERTKTDLLVLTEELGSIQEHDNVQNLTFSERDGTTQATIHNLRSQLQELQKVIRLKDSELSQYVNQKDLFDQQTMQIEDLTTYKHNSEDDVSEVRKGHVVGSGETLLENEMLLLQRATIDDDALTQAKAELERTRMDLDVLTEELAKLRLFQKHDDVQDRNPSEEDKNAGKADLEQALMLKTEELLASQKLIASLEETLQTTISNLNAQLHELEKLVQIKDSELLQYMNQQNTVKQQTKEIEYLNSVIDSLQKQMEDEKQKSESAASKKSMKDLTQQMNGDERMIMGTAKAANKDLDQPSTHLHGTQENVLVQESHHGMPAGNFAVGTENTDEDDWVVEALKDKTAQLLANQVLYTSTQETMQSTIDTLENQLGEVQEAIKEKDIQILLYLEEIKALKEQVKIRTDEHNQVMLAMENSLREKVAAALVSEAQLKAIQVHTKGLHVDNTSSQQEAAAMPQDSGSKPPHQEEPEAKLSILNLQVLELEKQLSDLHEQLQMERDQADLAHQLAADKERQLAKLQEVLESTRAKQALKQRQEEIGDDAVLQGSMELFKDHTMTKLEEQLQDLTQEATATKEELCHYRELSEKLKEQLMVKESSLAHLEEDLREVKKCLCHAEEKLAFYMKREIQEEQLQNTSGIDFTDAVRSPDWTTSSSQTDKLFSVNSSNQTSRVPERHIGVQKELEAAQLRTADEVAELMEQYTDKISQMQELHAAEILDMEARHISETESLRREQYAVVQALTDECDALKAVIEALKSSGEGVPNSTLSASYHFTDAASSDVGTECDWSQGTYDVQSLDQLPEGLQGDEDIPSELIPSKIKDLLRAVHQEGMQVLSLTEATSPEKEPPFKVQKQPWKEERKALLETIASLKELIAKMQIHKDSEAHTSSDFHGFSPDWRGELLRAIQEVFHKEQDVLMSAFHTQLGSMGRYDASALLNQMQHRLQEQGMEQINAMDCIQNADRRSLLLEIQDLRSQLTSLHSDPEIQSLFHPNAEGRAPYVQQEQLSHSQELHMQLNSMNTKASELQEQLGSERFLSAEVKNELALTKMELESNLKLQHKHFKEMESLRIELKRKREELDSLNEALANEQKKSRELQYTLEKQQTKRERQDLQEKEMLEDLQILLEEQNSKNLEINQQLEEEKKLVKDLQEQIVSQGSAHDTELSQERSRVLELQVLLDAEKARSTELSKAIECQQGLEAHLQSSEVDGRPGEHKPAEDVLRDLKGQLDSKHARIVELVNETEVYKLECVQLRQSLEEERQSLRKGLEAEQETSRLALKQVEELTATVRDLERQVRDRVAEIRRHQAEEKRLKETIQSLQSRTQDTKEGGSERGDLTKTSTARKSPSKLESSKPPLQMSGVPNLLCPDPLSVVNGDLGTEGAPFSIDRIKQRLQQVSSKLRQLATKANQRILFEKADDEDLVWSQNSIQEVLSQLEHVVILSLQGQNLVLPTGMSTNTLTEKLLTQNAELTGYVSRLTEEKNDLQNSLLRLEGEMSRYRARRPSTDYSMVDNAMNVDALLAAERESWNREKVSLCKSLKQAEAELSKVKAELRNEVTQRDLGRDSDNMALKRVYGKYLRSESYRKALVYQKKYLLLLLGGFQECEEATLSLIARMGGQPTYTDLEVITNRSRAFTRFRSAARVAIAISRMKFLVRRWQRATISTVSSKNRNSSGQTAGNEVRSDSAYHQTRSMELYGEQRISSCRSQSGFNSPQSTVNSQHRYFSASDPCSHLQHYDPDKALTDYIARLEALQKRLGSVPSGSSVNPSTHYSVRR